MRVNRPVAKISSGVWLCLLAAPIAVVTPAVAADLTQQLTSTWVPVTAYGFTLIAAMIRGQK